MWKWTKYFHGLWFESFKNFNILNELDCSIYTYSIGCESVTTRYYCHSHDTWLLLFTQCSVYIDSLFIEWMCVYELMSNDKTTNKQQQRNFDSGLLQDSYLHSVFVPSCMFVVILIVVFWIFSFFVFKNEWNRQIMITTPFFSVLSKFGIFNFGIRSDEFFYLEQRWSIEVLTFVFL